MPLLRATWLAATLLLGTAAWGQVALSEWELKAALVFNFARYIEWPERAFSTGDSPLVMCVIGRDRFGGAFTALEGRKLQGRWIKVRTGLTAEEGRNCHVAYLSEPTEHQVASVLRALGPQPVLTVSDAEGFVDAGGAIGIVAGDSRTFTVCRTAPIIGTAK